MGDVSGGSEVEDVVSTLFSLKQSSGPNVAGLSGYVNVGLARADEGGCSALGQEDDRCGSFAATGSNDQPEVAEAPPKDFCKVQSWKEFSAARPDVAQRSTPVATRSRSAGDPDPWPEAKKAGIDHGLEIAVSLLQDADGSGRGPKMKAEILKMYAEMSEVGYALG